MNCLLEIIILQVAWYKDDLDALKVRVHLGPIDQDLFTRPVKAVESTLRVVFNCLPGAFLPG